MFTRLSPVTLIWPAVIGALVCPPCWAQTILAAHTRPAVLGPPPPPPPATPLGFNEAVALADRDQPAVIAQRAAIDVALTEAVSASQLPDPKLKLGLQNVPTNSFSLTEDFMTQRTVSVEQTVPREQKRRLRGERARIEADKSAAEADDLQRSIRRDTALAWLSRYAAQRSDELLREQLTLAMRQREAAQIALRANKVGLQDLARAELEVQQAQDRVSASLAQIARARAELSRWIGAHAQREPAREFPDLPDPQELKYLRDGVERSPQLGAARRDIALAENELAQAKAAKLADWSVEIGYAKRGPAYADMISAQVSIDLPLFTADRQDRTVLAKQRDLERRQLMHEDHSRMVEAELDATYADWSLAKERAERYQEEVLPAAKQRVDAALAEYRAGRTELMSVLEAQRAEVDMRLQWVALRVAAAKARVQLQYLAE